MDGLKPHPAADRWPMLDKKRHAELVEDIRSNGQREPITLCEGMILDGRNRYKACQEIGVLPKTKVFEGNPWSYSWSLNGARRDVSDLQRAAIKYQLDQDSDEWQSEQDAKRKTIEAEANRKRREAAKEQPRKPDGTMATKPVVVPKEPPPAKKPLATPKPDPHKGRTERASAANVSPSTQAKVEWIANKRPDLLEKVARGEVKGSQAIKSIKADERKAVVDRIESSFPSKTKKEVKSGEWWQLGDHLLYCGDTSEKEFREQLPKASLAFADPPYGANKEGYDDSKFYWEHDYLQATAEIVVVTPGIVSIFEFANKTAMPYKWSVACWINNGMTRGAMGFGNWIYAAVFSDGSVFRQKQDFCQVAISNSETEDTGHTTRKPARFMSYIVETFTNRGDTVIDPFLGSGQTLLGCEALGRRCVGGEIDASFCSEIIARWESMTSREAVKK